MKVYTAATGLNGAAPVAKRPWRGFAVAVFALVFCSLLAPLAFLLGLYNRFPTGYLTDDRVTPESSLGVYKHLESGREQNLLKGDQTRIDNLVKKFGPSLTKDFSEKIKIQTDSLAQKKSDGFKDSTSKSQGSETKQTVVLKDLTDGNSRGFEVIYEKSCQIEFGSYCLWSVEHREVVEDSIVKRLKDQLFVARAYYPSIAKLKGNEELTREVKKNIQEHERMLSETISDSDLPLFAGKRIEKMDQTVTKAKSCGVDCRNVDRKLRQILYLTEDETHFHMKQSAFLYQLGVQTMPKTHHCLVLRLTVEYFKKYSQDENSKDSEKGKNVNKIEGRGWFRNYVVFSRNVLAVSVTINSTVTSSKESGNMVFHLLTDPQNFYAMKHWFARNFYKNATIRVLNIENFGSKLFPSEEFRISIRYSTATIKTEYVSVFGHSHFLLPEIFPDLERVIVLDDDLVIQRDLTTLWEIDLGGKVVGAVESCRVKLGQMKSYSNYGFNDSCLWMSGLNIVDLEKWRESNVSGTYRELLQKMQKDKKIDEKSWREMVLPLNIITFKDQIYPLEDSWVQSGLGHNYGIAPPSIERAPILHYNGNMKPWLDLGILKYKKYWRKFVTRSERFMDECNVNP